MRNYIYRSFYSFLNYSAKEAFVTIAYNREEDRLSKTGIIVGVNIEIYITFEALYAFSSIEVTLTWYRKVHLCMYMNRNTNIRHRSAHRPTHMCRGISIYTHI